MDAPHPRHQPAENNHDSLASEANSGSRPAVAYVEIQLHRLMQTVIDALEQAAHETQSEADMLPHNLLAAFHRVAYHIELFLQVTNTELHVVHCSGTTLELIRDLREAAAQRLEKFGKALRCPNGCLSQPFGPSDIRRCQKCFRKASRQLRKLVKTFRSTLEAIQ